MLTGLNAALNEIKRIKKEIGVGEQINVELILKYQPSEENMKRLAGYSLFAKALEELGGERTAENIAKACSRSNFSPENVCFNDNNDEQAQSTRKIKFICNKQLAERKGV